MFMQKIRRSTKKNRTILIVVVALLTLGIVGSFAVWNSNDYKAESQSGQSEMSAADLLKQYQDYLLTNAPADKNNIDYSTASNMATQYMTLVSYASDAASEANSSGDSVAMTGYMKTMQDAAKEAAEYYQKSLDLAPDTLNDAGKAALMANMAHAQYYSNDVENARSNFAAAYELSPTIAVVQGYSEFLFGVDGLEAAETFLNSYMETIEDQESTDYTTAKSLLDYYSALDKLYNGASEESTEGEDGLYSIDIDNLTEGVSDMVDDQTSGDDQPYTEGEATTEGETPDTGETTENPVGE